MLWHFYIYIGPYILTYISGSLSSHIKINEAFIVINGIDKYIGHLCELKCVNVSVPIKPVETPSN